MYVQTAIGFGQVATTLDINKAIRSNRIYKQTLGWQKYYDSIIKFLGFTAQPSETEFAQGVAQWQQSQGLNADGMIGPSTWKAMQSAIIPSSSGSNVQSVTVPGLLLKKGKMGAAIWVIQRLLNIWLTRSQAALPPLKEDGIFGSKTEKVVRSFQDARGLKVDGLVGSQTWGQLVDELIILNQTHSANPPLGQFWGLHGIPLPQCFTPEPPDPKDTFIKPQFDAMVASNVAVATLMTIPLCYEQKLLEYAVHNPLDGLTLIGGYLRCPLYFKGGWILKLVPTALAMTLNTRVFVDGPVDIGTYVHEIVHVWQYKILGITGFLISYFGVKAVLTILARLLSRRRIHVSTSNPHEVQAYNIEGRFMAWYRSHPCP